MFFLYKNKYFIIQIQKFRSREFQMLFYCHFLYYLLNLESRWDEDDINDGIVSKAGGCEDVEDGDDEEDCALTKAAESFGCLAVPGLFSLKRTFSEDSDSGAEIFRCSFNSFESFVSSGTFVFGCLFEAIGPDAADNAFFSLSFLGCGRKNKH